MVCSVVTETDMNVLLRVDEVDSVSSGIRRALDTSGAVELQVTFTAIESACEPDNVLVAEYLQRFDSPPVSEQVHRLTVTAHWERVVEDTRSITREVAACLPAAPDGSPGLWFGQTSTLRSCE